MLVAGSVGIYLAFLPVVRCALTQRIPNAAGITAEMLPPAAAGEGGRAPTIEEVAALGRAGAFVPIPRAKSASVLNRTPREERWYRLVFPDAVYQQRHPVIDLIWRSYDYAALYTPREDGGWTETLCGSGISPSDPRVTKRWMAFELSLPPDRPLTAYLHVRDYHRLPTQFFYWPDSTAFNAWERFVFIQHFLFFGLWGGIMVHALFQYAMGRQRLQLYYAGFLLSIGLLELLASGLYRLAFAWPERFPVEILIGISAASGLFFLCLFARCYLQTAADAPRLDRLLRWMRIIPLCMLAASVLCLWPRTAYAYQQAGMLMAAVSFIAMIGISALRWRQGCPRAGFLLLSFLPYSLALLLWISCSLGTAAHDDGVRFAMQIGLALQLVLLTLTTAWQHRLLLARNLQLQTGYSLRLEAEVEERTRQLTALSEDLSHTVDERNRLLSLIGHDLRGPASSLQALTRILADNPGRFSARELADLADEIAHACTLQIELLNNLLAWGCAGSAPNGRTGRPPENTDLRTEAAEVCRLLGWMARIKRIDVVNDVPANLRAMISPQYLQVILRNLVVNAIKFTPLGGLIVIEGKKKEPDCIEIRVTDSGVGIPPARLAQLLAGPVESMPGTNEEKGVGFGLSLCRDLVRAADGDLSIKSKEGEGTTVILSLAAAAAAKPQSQDRVAAARSLKAGGELAHAARRKPEPWTKNAPSLSS